MKITYDQSEAIFTAKKLLNYYKKFNNKIKEYIENKSWPTKVILSYQKSLVPFIKEKFADNLDEFTIFGEDIFIVKNSNIAIITNLSIGAPATAGIVEELIALGTKEIISIGTAGSLQRNIDIGDIILVEKAIREEGTSYHYMKNSKYSYASKKILKTLEKNLQTQANSQINYHKGTIWTTDAVFRETVNKVKTYQNQGVLAVDMEASALFAVATHYNLLAATLFTISDSLADTKNQKWTPQFRSAKTKKGLETIFEIAYTLLINHSFNNN